jgi:hypothetical protein
MYPARRIVFTNRRASDVAIVGGSEHSR